MIILITLRLYGIS